MPSLMLLAKEYVPSPSSRSRWEPYLVMPPGPRVAGPPRFGMSTPFGVTVSSRIQPSTVSRLTVAGAICSTPMPTLPFNAT